MDGFRAAVPLVLGIETGLYTWVIASALGVAAVVAASETAYTVLRYVGAGVLLLLGVQAWLASRRISVESPAVAEPVAPSRWWRAATTGAVTQLGNPKVAVFMVAFFPQFIPATSNVLLTTLLLGLIQVVVDGGWYLLLGIFAGRARKLIAMPRFRRILERATGTVLIAFGVRMAVSKL